MGRLLKIGIECESIETDSWGIAQIINRILAEIDRRPELSNEFKFYLYFKSQIPTHPYLDNPIFVKRIIRVPFLPASFSLYYYVYLPIRKLMDGIDVMFYANYMLPLIHMGKSIVLSAHDAYYEAHNKNIPLRYRLAYRIFATWGAKRATKVQAMSDFGKKELANVFRISPDRIVVNHLGIDPAERTSPYPSDRPYLLFVGQAFPRRHLRETLLAFEQIAPKYPELDFRVVGYDKYTPPVIAELVRNTNVGLGSERVIWKERAEHQELISLYAGARAVAYISDREAFGLPPLEALNYGSVPIVADNELTHEIFGTAAFFVRNPDSIDDIQEILEQALTDTDHQNKILAQRQSILNQFTWKTHTDRWLALIKEIAHV